MSRSYKHNPFLTDNGNSGYSKRIANRICRRKLKNVYSAPSRSYFKRLTDSWEICDWKWRETREEAIEWYLHEAPDVYHEMYPTLEDWLNEWAKWHRRK